MKTGVGFMHNFQCLRRFFISATAIGLPLRKRFYQAYLPVLLSVIVLENLALLEEREEKAIMEKL